MGLSVGCNGLLRNDDAYLDLDATSDAVSMGGGGGEASSTTAGGRGGASGSLDDGGGGGGAPIDVDRDAAFVDRVADTAVDTSDDSSIRDMAKDRYQRRTERRGERRAADPIERLRSRADAMTQTAADLKKLADAADPLYKSLNDDQKHRLRYLVRSMRGHRMAMHGHGHRGFERD